MKAFSLSKILLLTQIQMFKISADLFDSSSRLLSLNVFIKIANTTSNKLKWSNIRANIAIFCLQIHSNLNVMLIRAPHSPCRPRMTAADRKRRSSPLSRAPVLATSSAMPLRSLSRSSSKDWRWQQPLPHTSSPPPDSCRCCAYSECACCRTSCKLAKR